MYHLNWIKLTKKPKNKREQLKVREKTNFLLKFYRSDRYKPYLATIAAAICGATTATQTNWFHSTSLLSLFDTLMF